MLPAPGSTLTVRDDDIGDVLANIGAFRPAGRGKGAGILSRMRGNESAAQMIRKYDEEGPGIVGFYLDLKADVIGLVDFEVQRWSSQGLDWQWDTHPAASSALANDLVGPNGERLPEFARHYARELEAVGEVGFAPVKTANGTRYRVLPIDPGSYEIVGKENGQPSVLGFKGSRTAKRPTSPEEAANREDWVEIPVDQIFRIYRPHPKWFAEPYTPLARALIDIRRYENASRALHRAVASQLINGGLLWFKGTANDLKPTQGANRRRVSNTGEGGRLGHLGIQIKSIMDAGERSLADYDETEVESAMFHPVVTAEVPPQFIDSGKAVDRDLLDVKQNALEDFARSVNIPMSVLVEGQGAAQRLLNEWLQDKTFKQTSIMPLARRVAAGLTVAFLHPRLRELQQREPGLFIDPKTNTAIPITDFRIWPNEASITQDEPDIADIKDAVKCGVANPDMWLDAIDGQRYKMERPAEVSDFDWWQMLQAKQARDFDYDTPTTQDDPALPEGEPIAARAAWWTSPWQP